MPHRTREIKCTACGHRYHVTRVHTIEGRTIVIEEPTILGKAYCPSCGSPAQWMQAAAEPKADDDA